MSRQLNNPAYHRLCDAILSKDAKLLLRLLHDSENSDCQIDIRTLGIEDPLGCLALLACLGFIERRQ